MRVCFLNPFGTDAYDGIITEVLQPSLRDSTTLAVRHLESGPRNLDYYAPKQLVQTEVLKAALKAQEDGFDALVIGCCYDPALTETREILSIPVVGPLEASTALARIFGHRYAVLTDHWKAVPLLRDLIRVYGVEANCVAVDAIDWYVDDMIVNPGSVARDATKGVKEVMARTGAETVVMGCTIVSACYELGLMQGLEGVEELSVINPNVMAVKLAELLADLADVGQFRMSRQAYYQGLHDHSTVEAEQIYALFGSPGPTLMHTEGNPR